MAAALVLVLGPGAGGATAPALLVAASCLGLGPAALAAQEIVTVAAPTGPSDVQYAEPHFATNPEDPDQVVLGAIAVEPDTDWTVRAFRSADGGMTWRRTELPATGELRCFGDPWVTWGAGETVYLVCLTQRPIPGEDDWNAAVLLYRSDDAGATWREPLLAPDDDVRGSWDHAIGRLTPEGDVLVAGTRSRVGPDGFGFARYRPAAHAFEPLRSYLPPEQVNDNFGAAVPLSEGRIAFTYFTMRSGGPRPMYAVRLTSDAEERTRLRDHVTPWGFPMLAGGVFPSGDSPRLYAVWLEDGEVGGLDVWLAWSGDEGRTWSDPRLVNDPSVVAFRARPQVAVSEEAVAVTWYDTRHAESPGNPQPCGDVYVRRLELDGSPASPEVRATRSGRCPNDGDPAGVRERWRAGGDYAALELRGAVVDLSWAEPGPTGHRIRFARVRVPAGS